MVGHSRSVNSTHVLCGGGGIFLIGGRIGGEFGGERETCVLGPKFTKGSNRRGVAKNYAFLYNSQDKECFLESFFKKATKTTALLRVENILNCGAIYGPRTRTFRGPTAGC